MSITSAECAKHTRLHAQEGSGDPRVTVKHARGELQRIISTCFTSSELGTLQGLPFPGIRPVGGMTVFKEVVAHEGGPVFLFLDRPGRGA